MDLRTRTVEKYLSASGLWRFRCSDCGDCGGNYKSEEIADWMMNAHKKFPHSYTILRRD